MKLCLILILLIKSIQCLNVDEYTSSIATLLTNETFLQDYFEWSLKLFSEKDYFYGKQREPFQCKIDRTPKMPDEITVHTLRPTDVQCVAALGDSLTAGLGAHALTPIGLFTENRGLSWSIGGDSDYDHIVTLPNILRQYNPKLKGYSTKSSVIFLKGQNSSHNALNVAKSGDRSSDMINQAKILHQRFLSNDYCNLENDWKVITLFVGGNDLCVFCTDNGMHNPIEYRNSIEETLDYLQKYFPRTFVNLVLVLDVRLVKILNAGGKVCELLHQKTCPCAAYPNEQQAEILNQWIVQYHQDLIDLINTKKYDQNDQFTVVVQPFMANTTIQYKDDGQIDYSYFAPDCFHFSGKGHSRAAQSLWNNMIEQVGQKKSEWHPEDHIECPTEDRPYFSTYKNSRPFQENIHKY